MPHARSGQPRLWYVFEGHTPVQSSWLMSLWATGESATRMWLGLAKHWRTFAENEPLKRCADPDCT